MPELDTRLTAGGPWWLQKEPDTFLQALQTGAHMAAQKKEYEQNALRLNLARQEMDLRSQAQQLQARQIEQNMGLTKLKMDEAQEDINDQSLAAPVVRSWMNGNLETPLPEGISPRNAERLTTMRGRLMLQDRNYQAVSDVISRMSKLDDEGLAMMNAQFADMELNPYQMKAVPPDVLGTLSIAETETKRRSLEQQAKLYGIRYGEQFKATHPYAERAGEVVVLENPTTGEPYAFGTRTPQGGIVGQTAIKSFDREKITTLNARRGLLAGQIKQLAMLDAEANKDAIAEYTKELNEVNQQLKQVYSGLGDSNHPSSMPGNKTVDPSNPLNLRFGQ